MNSREKKELIQFFAREPLANILLKYRQDRGKRIQYVLIARDLIRRLDKLHRYKPLTEKLRMFLQAARFKID